MQHQLLSEKTAIEASSAKTARTLTQICTEPQTYSLQIEIMFTSLGYSIPLFLEKSPAMQCYAMLCYAKPEPHEQNKKKAMSKKVAE